MSHLFASLVSLRMPITELPAIGMRDGMAADYQAGRLAGVSEMGVPVGIC